MEIESVGPQARSFHVDEGDVMFLGVNIELHSTIAHHTGFGFKKFRKVQCNGKYTVQVVK